MADRAQTDHIWDTSAQIDSAGSANAYVIDTAEAITGYARGMPPIRFKANFANTGAATANINGLGAVALKKFGGATDLASGDIISGGVYTLAYDGTNLQVLELNTGVIATANLADDAVTYAKLQDVSATARILGRKTSGAGDVEECTLSEVLDFIGSAAQGDILYRGASAWARLGAGTARQFLQTQGGAANPAWASGMAHLGSVTASGAVNAGFTNLDLTNFGAVIMTGANVQHATDNTELLLRYSQSGTFLFGAADYQWGTLVGSFGSTPAAFSDISDSRITVAGGIGNAAGEFSELSIMVLRPGASDGRKSSFAQIQYRTTAGVNTYGWAFGGFIANANPIDGVRLQPSSGNFSGVFDLWGLQI